MTPQQWTTGPGATLPSPVAALILVAIVVLFTAGLCGHATQPPPRPWAALRRVLAARHPYLRPSPQQDAPKRSHANRHSESRPT